MSKATSPLEGASRPVLAANIVSLRDKTSEKKYKDTKDPQNSSVWTGDVSAAATKFSTPRTRAVPLGHEAWLAGMAAIDRPAAKEALTEISAWPPCT